MVWLYWSGPGGSKRRCGEGSDGRIARDAAKCCSTATQAKRAHVLAATGRCEEASAILNELLEKRNETWVTAYEIAIIYCLLGDPDNAFKWLVQAEREHAVGFTFVRVDPHLENLHSDPRFADLIRETDKTIP